MTTGYTGPRLIKGALVSVDPDSPPAQVISFQYNPASVRRALTPQIVGGETGDRSEVVRFTGAPVQTVTLEVVLDASDQLQQGDSTAAEYGIAPQLAALELLVYPSLSQVTLRQAQLETGIIEIIPRVMAVPRTYLLWGPKRVLPVRINSYEISEEMFDPNLNPIRATISLSMRALTYSDLSADDTQYSRFLAYQQSLISMAAQAPKSAASSEIGLTGL